MFKVIFRLEKLLLKLNNVDCQVHAKKGNFTVLLTPSIKITNGQALIGIQTEFFILQKDPLFLIQVSLLVKGTKKLGGHISLNVGQWDQNVHHSTVASLQNSPDRNAEIRYTFFYLKRSDLQLNRSIMLCSEYRNKNLFEIQSTKRQLTKKHDQLQGQVKKLKQENQILISNQKSKMEEMNYKKTDHDKKIKSYTEGIEKNTMKNKNLKKRNQQIINIIKKYGNLQTKLKLQKRYPQRGDNNKFERKASPEQEKNKQQQQQNEDVCLRSNRYSSEGNSSNFSNSKTRSRSRDKKRVKRAINQQQNQIKRSSQQSEQSVYGSLDN